MDEIPELLKRSAEEKRRRLLAREFRATRDVRDYFENLVPDLRTEVQDYFLKFFVLGVALDAMVTPSWDQVSARRLHTVEQLTADFEALVAEIEAAVEDDLDEQLADAYEEGYMLGLWDLSLGGVDPDDMPDPPTHDEILALLLGGAVAGLGYDQRLRTWGDVYAGKYQQWIRASVAGGRTLEDTLTGFDGIASAYAGRVEGLAGDELTRAFTLGSTTAWGSVPGAVRGEVWLTREDPLVCPLCAAKHLTITRDQPVIDSHPSCWCIKAPILINAVTEQPVDYVAFLRLVGKR